MDVEIQVPKSIFEPRYGRGQSNRQKQQISDMRRAKEELLDNLWSFKIRETHEPDTTETRLIPRCCKHCLTNSELMIFEEIKHLSLIDCLTQSGPHYGEPFSHKLPAWKDLEKDKELLSLYLPQNLEDPSSLDSIKKGVLDVLSQLHVSTIGIGKQLQRAFISFSKWLTKKYLACFFEEVLVHEGHLEMLKDLQSKNLPVVYVPTFRSSLDKTLLIWIMASHGLQTPLFIPNYNDSPMLAKYFGGIGAPRKFYSSSSEEDLKYSSALAAYLRGLLRSNIGILLNLEARRSRTGHPSPEIYGSEFLRVILDEYNNNKIEDAYFLPFSVSYESLPEANDIANDSLSQHTRKASSLASVFLEILLYFLKPAKPKGKVRVDFSQPICFRELNAALRKGAKVRKTLNGGGDSYVKIRDCSLLRWSSNESINSISPLYGATSPLYLENDRNEDSVVLDVMSHHLLYDAGKCESIMPTHLLAFLMMKKFKHGAYFNQLVPEMNWLVTTIKSLNKDFGFYVRNCDPETIIFRGVELLQNELTVDWNDEMKMFKITPKTERENLIRLEYYANYILPEFMMEAIISAGIFAISGLQLTTLQGLDVMLEIKDADLVQHCKKVYEVFIGSFLLNAPCLTSETAIRTEVQRLSEIGLLSLKMRDPKAYCWEEDEESDDDMYPSTAVDEKKDDISDQTFAFTPEAVKIITTFENFKRMNFSRSLVLPYLEIFSFLVKPLRILLPVKEMEQVKVKNHLFEELLKQEEADFRNYRELITVDTVKQFLATCEDHGIIYYRLSDDGGKRFYGLTQAYNNEIELDKLADNILFYVTI